MGYYLTLTSTLQLVFDLVFLLCQCTLRFPSKVLHMHSLLIVSRGSNNHSQEKLKAILIQLL